MAQKRKQEQQEKVLSQGAKQAAQAQTKPAAAKTTQKDSARMPGAPAPGGMPTQGGDPRAQLMAMLQHRAGGQMPGMQMPGAPMAGAQMPGAPMTGGMHAQGADPRAQLMAMMQARRAQGAGMPMGAKRPGEGGGNTSPQPTGGTGGNVPDPVGYGRQLPVDEKRIREAQQTLLDYQGAKSLTDQRIIRCQEWWRQRNWSMIEEERGTVGTTPHKSATAWLKASIVGKHADYMESFPEPLFVARNQEDEPEAKHLTEIVPVVLKQIGFDEVYSDVGWQKIVEGTGVYAVTWDGQAQHGLGDVCIRKVNVLNLFTEPGVEDIQDSSNVFLVRMEDDRKLISQYPQLAGKLGAHDVKPLEYREKEKKDRRNKSAVVDWYYKKWVGGKEVLHYCKYVGETVLYASENDPQAQQGYYQHGLYPFICDRYLPDAESIYAQGLVDEGKDAQTDIDTMNQAMVMNAVCNATPRYFMNQSGGVNPEQFLDWSIPIVDANVNLGQDTLKRIEVPQMDGNTLSFYQAKIEELRTVTGNAEIENGEAPAGVTSGVALAALRENSGRQSKDSNRASYRAMSKLYLMVVELIRQFYNVERQFRIVGEDGMAEYLTYSNAQLTMRTNMDSFGGVTHRLPLFDVDVHVQRENAYTRMAMNDLATQFYQLGFFAPMNAPMALTALKMMDFTGKEKLVRLIQENFVHTMMQMGGTATGTSQPAQTTEPVEKGATTPAEDDATEAGVKKTGPGHTPATNRMEQRVNDATRV